MHILVSGAAHVELHRLPAYLEHLMHCHWSVLHRTLTYRSRHFEFLGPREFGTCFGTAAVLDLLGQLSSSHGSLAIHTSYCANRPAELLHNCYLELNIRPLRLHTPYLSPIGSNSGLIMELTMWPTHESEAGHNGWGAIGVFDVVCGPHSLPFEVLPATIFARAALYAYDDTEDRPSLDVAIVEWERLVSLIPNTNGQKYDSCRILGALYARRHDATQDLGDLDKAVTFFQLSIDTAPFMSKDYCNLLYYVGRIYLMRSEARPAESHDYLDKAITFLDKAQDTHPVSLHRAPYFASLGRALFERYQRSGAVDDLDRDIAIRLFGIRLWKRFSDMGNEEDYKELAAVLHGAAEHEWDEVLQILAAMTLAERFRYSRRHVDLDEAASMLKKVVASTDSVDRRSEGLRRMATDFLSHVLFHRFLEFRDANDRESSLLVLEELMNTSRQDPEALAKYLSRAGYNHHSHFQLTRSLSDIDEAIVMTRRAIELAPDWHYEKSPRWCDLGVLLHERFAAFGRKGDLEEAHICHQRAVDLTTNNCRHRLRSLRFLERSYMECFKASQSLDDLNGAVEVLCDTVEASPKDWPEKVFYLSELGTSLITRYAETSSFLDLDEAISAFKEGALSEQGPLWPRLVSSALWGIHIALFHDNLLPLTDHAARGHGEDIGEAAAEDLHWDGSAEFYLAFCRMMELIPRVVWLGDTISVRYIRLQTISLFVRQAASIIALFPEKWSTSVEWLEQRRSIVWRQELNLRTLVDEIGVTNPALATRLKSFSASFHSASNRHNEDGHTPRNTLTDGTADSDSSAETHRRLAEGWSALLQEVRQARGFEGFLLPKQLSELQHAAHIGPIVVLNEGVVCEAFIIVKGQEDVPCVVLDLAPEQAEELHVDLSRLLTSSNVRSRLTLEKRNRCQSDTQEMRRILLTLWIKVVKPVLDALDFPVLTESESHPRIVWCPTGSLAFLPIHAAGDYSRAEPGHQISDYIVSSYTSTISTLMDASNRHIPSEFRFLAVSQPDTPGLTSLPYTDVEIQKVKEHIGHMQMEELAGEAATVAAVHDAIERCSWIHLACHAIQDPNDPLKSAFCLADGRLQLQDIIRKTHPHADFAFLSACQTSTGDQKLSDEAVHLAAGMQLAGYRSIIATMWSIGDEDGPLVADEVYAHLLRDGQADSSRAAHALHHAVLKLQETTKPDERDDSWFLRWVPFIHIGA